MGDGPLITRPGLLSLLAILAVSLWTRLSHISDISFWFDESCSWKISQFAWGEMFDAISRDAHPPVFYILLKAWGAAFGDDAAVIRGFSVLFGLATIIAAFWFVRTASSGTRSGAGRSDFAAILAAVLVGLSAVHVEMSQEARPYTFGTFLTLVSAGCLLRGLRGDAGTAMDWVLFTATAAVLSLTHYYGLFTVAALFLFAGCVLVGEFWRTGWNTHTKTLLARIVLSAWAIQVVWSLWLPVFQNQLFRANGQLWMQPVDWHDLATVCWKLVADGHTGDLPRGWAPVAVGIWVAPLIVLVWRGPRGHWLVALCCGVPLAGAVAYSLTVRSILGVRYLLFAHVFLLIGWALLIARWRRSATRLALAGAILAWCAFWHWEFAKTRSFQARMPGVRGAVAHLNRARQPGQPIIVSYPFVHPIVQKYADSKTGIFARYVDLGNRRLTILEGPPLREAECRTPEQIAGLSDPCIWTVDVENLFQQMTFAVSLPRSYRLVAQWRFPERYRFHMDIMIRKYELRPDLVAERKR